MEKNLELALTKSIRTSDSGNIFIDPFCDFFGIQTRNQLDRLKQDPICQSDMQKISCQSIFGDKKLRYCIGKRGFIRWIQIINAAIVRTELQELFVQYQVAVFDYLYNGNESKIAQLEDIRTYALNINRAISINRQLMEYIAEQKQHRDLCLSASPTDWTQIKANLFQEKQLPEAPEQLKAIEIELPNDIAQLQNLKKNIQTNLLKTKNRLLYNSNYKKEIETPLPEGYKKEMVKLRMKKFEEQLEKVNQKLIEIINQ